MIHQGLVGFVGDPRVGLDNQPDADDRALSGSSSGRVFGFPSISRTGLAPGESQDHEQGKQRRKAPRKSQRC